MPSELDSDTVMSEFEFVHFWADTQGKCMNPIILPVMDYIVSLLFFYKDSILSKLNDSVSFVVYIWILYWAVG